MDNITKEDKLTSFESRGVDEVAIDKLTLEVYDYADKIKSLLNQIEDLVAGTSTYYVCDSGDKFREKFSLLQNSFKNVNSNVLNYADELIDAKKQFVNISSDVSVMTLESAQKVLDSGIEAYQEKR